MIRRIVAALMAVLLAMAPAGALAAKKAKIAFPAKVGLMSEGGAVTLKPKLKGVKAAEVSYSSSDAAVVAVEGSVARGLKPGKAVVTATGGGASAKAGVVVLPVSVSLAVGEKFSLPRGGVETYKIGNKGVAAVNRQGVVTGVGPGQTALQVRYGKQRVTVAVSVAESPRGSAAAALDCANQTDRIVLVDYTGGSRAELSVHEKVNGVWVERASCDAYVGKNGIDKAREGDGRTPTGAFNLTTPFGIREDPGAAMPYTQVTKYHYWCGDPDSAYYNQLVDERMVDRKHTARDEYLIDYKGSYNYGMFIDYNAEGIPDKGSCIFLHCTGKNKYTAGCVAVPEKMMKQIVRWAGSGTKIVIRKKP